MRNYYFVATLRSGGLLACCVIALFTSRPLAAQQAENLVKLTGISSLFDFSAETRIGAVTPHGANTGWRVRSNGMSDRLR